MPRLATFIRENTEPILSDWEAFARSLPRGEMMNIAALRDHARSMLRVIADDLAGCGKTDAFDEFAR